MAENSHKIFSRNRLFAGRARCVNVPCEKTAETLIFLCKGVWEFELVGAQRPGENFELSTGYPQFFIIGEFGSLTSTSEYAFHLFSKSFIFFCL
jgi:hypothetical protein